MMNLDELLAEFDNQSEQLQARNTEILRRSKTDRWWSIWVEGYASTGEHGTASLMATVSASTFDEAVQMHRDTLPESNKRLWKKDPQTGQWSYLACAAFPDESSARRNFG